MEWDAYRTERHLLEQVPFFVYTIAHCLIFFNCYEDKKQKIYMDVEKYNKI